VPVAVPVAGADVAVGAFNTKHQSICAPTNNEPTERVYTHREDCHDRYTRKHAPISKELHDSIELGRVRAFLGPCQAILDALGDPGLVCRYAEALLGLAIGRPDDACPVPDVVIDGVGVARDAALLAQREELIMLQSSHLLAECY
jgi:hypothetical protein